MTDDNTEKSDSANSYNDNGAQKDIQAIFNKKPASATTTTASDTKAFKGYDKQEEVNDAKANPDMHGSKKLSMVNGSDTATPAAVTQFDESRLSAEQVAANVQGGISGIPSDATPDSDSSDDQSSSDDSDANDSDSSDDQSSQSASDSGSAASSAASSASEASSSTSDGAESASVDDAGTDDAGNKYNDMAYMTPDAELDMHDENLPVEDPVLYIRQSKKASKSLIQSLGKLYATGSTITQNDMNTMMGDLQAMTQAQCNALMLLRFQNNERIQDFTNRFKAIDKKQDYIVKTIPKVNKFMRNWVKTGIPDKLNQVLNGIFKIYKSPDFQHWAKKTKGNDFKPTRQMLSEAATLKQSDSTASNSSQATSSANSSK